MKFDFAIPMTFYELLAIVLAAVRVVVKQRIEAPRKETRRSRQQTNFMMLSAPGFHLQLDLFFYLQEYFSVRKLQTIRLVYGLEYRFR